MLTLLDMLIDMESYPDPKFYRVLDDFEQAVKELLKPVCEDLDIIYEYTDGEDTYMVKYTIICNNKKYKAKIYVDPLYTASVPYDFIDEEDTDEEE